MTPAPPPKPGLQIERTHLAWERSAVGFLAIAVIVLFHHTGPLAGGRLTIAALAVLLSLVMFGISRSRGGIWVHTSGDGRMTVRTPALAVPLMGWGTAGLAAAIVAAMWLAS